MVQFYPCVKLYFLLFETNFHIRLWSDFDQIVFPIFYTLLFVCIRLALVVELIRKTNADRFRRFDDIL